VKTESKLTILVKTNGTENENHNSTAFLYLAVFVL